jgi:hypothetical protein
MSCTAGSLEVFLHACFAPLGRWTETAWFYINPFQFVAALDQRLDGPGKQEKALVIGMSMYWHHDTRADNA